MRTPQMIPSGGFGCTARGRGRPTGTWNLFIASVEDPGRADRLAIAIEGRGAFRRFKDVLAHWPGELERWYALSEERQRGRARSWLTEAGYRVLPAARRDPD